MDANGEMCGSCSPAVQSIQPLLGASAFESSSLTCTWVASAVRSKSTNDQVAGAVGSIV